MVANPCLVPARSAARTEQGGPPRPGASTEGRGTRAPGSDTAGRRGNPFPRRREVSSTHPVALGVGLLAVFAGLGLVVVGGVALLWVPTGFLPVGLGLDLIVGGGLTAVVAVFL